MFLMDFDFGQGAAGNEKTDRTCGDGGAKTHLQYLLFDGALKNGS
jgi:hypothetical protein